MKIRDEVLSSNVSNSIAQDRRLGGQMIAVRVADGNVFLKGMVDTEEQKTLAEMVAKGISGIRSVNTEELRVREAN